jgi:hypothetical protein
MAVSCRVARWAAWRSFHWSGSQAGGPDAKWEDELGGPRVGFTRGAFDLVVPGFYPLTGSIVTVRYKPPTRKPDAWAPSFLSDPVDCYRGILSSIGVVK